MKKSIKNTKKKLHNQVILNETDRVILSSLKTIVDGVAEIFGNYCEVVLHSFEDLSHSCIKITHGHVTGRSVGSPLTDFGIEIVNKADSLDKDVIGSYFSTLDDGRILKSVTMLIRNDSGKPIGCMCINIDMSMPFIELVRSFLPPRGVLPAGAIVEHFPLVLDDLIRRLLEIVVNDVNKQKEISPREKNKMIIKELYKKGIFNVKGVVDVIAKEMGISRYTIYNYIRDGRVI